MIREKAEQKNYELTLVSNFDFCPQNDYSIEIACHEDERFKSCCRSHNKVRYM